MGKKRVSKKKGKSGLSGLRCKKFSKKGKSFVGKDCEGTIINNGLEIEIKIKKIKMDGIEFVD